MKKRKYFVTRSSILKIIAETIDGFFNIIEIEDNDEFKTKYNIFYKKYRKIHPIGTWYFHGKLAERIGYDLGVITNIKEKLTGIYRCEVYGISQPCIGFFWTCDTKDSFLKESLRGLVCLSDEKEDLTYAYNCYINKESIL